METKSANNLWWRRKFGHLESKYQDFLKNRFQILNKLKTLCLRASEFLRTWNKKLNHGIVIESEGSIIQSQDLCNRNKSLNRFLSFHFMIELMSIPNINWVKSSLILCCSLTLEHEFMASEMLPNIQIVDNIQVNAQLLSDSSIW